MGIGARIGGESEGALLWRHHTHVTRGERILPSQGRCRKIETIPNRNKTIKRWESPEGCPIQKRTHLAPKTGNNLCPFLAPFSRTTSLVVLSLQVDQATKGAVLKFTRSILPANRSEKNLCWKSPSVAKRAGNAPIGSEWPIEGERERAVCGYDKFATLALLKSCKHLCTWRAG
ncbi:hypothetical protein NPIL_510481 [Nephila pilipes]|uniref:Uncharacterized protein n=1 Tax=Nephila pilipes TaxID=299642 RepID=A0A8X6QDM6_NEPPI|nr:hypothetical protein NPIL_510481 [Nephila pilipes]